jgi:hypothetical protein
MPAVLSIFLLVLAACSAPAESAETTTTTTPAATTSNESTTSTVGTTTTTTGPECVERDGVLFDSRGFVCPPRLVTSQYPQGHSQSVVHGYRPGTYVTTVFGPGFSFTRDVGFKSTGESMTVVNFDEHPTCDTNECAREVVALSPQTTESLLSNLDSVDWIVDVVSSPVQFWGTAGTQVDFTVGDCPLNCILSLEGFQDAWGFREGHAVTVLSIDVAGGPLGILIAADQSRFDQYWTDVAEPILASIEFTGG